MECDFAKLFVDRVATYGYAKVAKTASLSINTCYNWGRGKIPHPKTIKAICEKLGWHDILNEACYALGEIPPHEEQSVWNDFIIEMRKFGLIKISKMTGLPTETLNSWCRKEICPTLIEAQTVANVMDMEFLLFDMLKE